MMLCVDMMYLSFNSKNQESFHRRAVICWGLAVSQTACASKIRLSPCALKRAVTGPGRGPTAILILVGAPAVRVSMARRAYLTARDQNARKMLESFKDPASAARQIPVTPRRGHVATDRPVCRDRRKQSAGIKTATGRDRERTVILIRA